MKDEPRDWEHPTLSEARRIADLPAGPPDPILDRPRFESEPTPVGPGQLDFFGHEVPKPKRRRTRKRPHT